VPTSCHIADGVIDSSYSGEVSPAELEKGVRAAIALATRSGNYRFFTDVSGLTGGHSAGDLFAVIALLEELGLPRTLREAIVVPASTLAAPDVQFYEDACRNRGWNVRLFPDRKSALAWLREGPAPREA
jgi:hypothetical protein